jgi:CubicO group peptidase (beta-lactamase class C family)
MIHFLVGLTLEELQHRDRYEFAADALVSIAAYGRPTAPCYAAIWHPSTRAGGEPGRTILGFPGAEPMEAYPFRPGGTLDLSSFGTNLIPLLVTATGDVRSHGELGVHTTWVFEEYPVGGRGKLAPPPRRGIVAASLESLLERLGPFELGVGYGEREGCSSLEVVWYTSIKPNGKRGDPITRFLAIASRGDKTPYDLFEAPADPQRRIEDNQFGVMEAPIMKKARGSYMRLHAAVPAPKNKNGARATVMHMKRDTYEAWPAKLEEDFACGAITDGPLRSSELALCRDVRKLQNFVPLEVRANGVGGDIRFCVTWAKKPKPKTRYFRLWSGAEDAPPQIKVTLQQPSSPHGRPALPFPEYDEATNNRLLIMRDAIEARMRDKNISNAQVAIAVNGRLKLMWSLTCGEAGWTMTQPRHKFRVASSTKILTGMRAVTLGESFLKQSLVYALGVTPPANLSGTQLSDWADFFSVRIEDCLRHTSGLATARDYFTDAFNFGRMQLPVAPGDQTLSYDNNAVPPLMVWPPRETEGYSNVAFISVGEAIGMADQKDPSRYFAAMTDWFPLNKLFGLAQIVPATKDASFDAGEAPIRSPRAVQRDTYVNENDIPVAELPPYVSGGYGQSDAAFLGGTGVFSMSAATLARLLQINHPQEAPSPRTGVRLTLEQVERLHEKQAGLVTRVSRQEFPDDSQSPPMFGLGFASTFVEAPTVVPVRGVTNKNYDYLQAAWGGDMFGTGRTDYVHLTYLPTQGPPQSMTVAYSTNCKDRLLPSVADGVISTQAKLIFNSGGWDNDVDLFPALDLD